MRSKTSFAAHLFVAGFTASLRGMWCGVNVASMPLPPLPMLSVANLVHSPHWKLKSRNLNSTFYSGWMGTKIEIGGEAMHLRSRDLWYEGHAALCAKPTICRPSAPYLCTVADSPVAPFQFSCGGGLRKGRLNFGTRVKRPSAQSAARHPPNCAVSKIARRHHLIFKYFQGLTPEFLYRRPKRPSALSVAISRRERQTFQAEHET